MRTFGFNMTVTRFFPFWLVLFSKQVSVAVGNNALDVAHTRVAHLHAVSIEDLIEAKCSREMLVN
jgi:hypothetical protein